MMKAIKIVINIDRFALKAFQPHTNSFLIEKLLSIPLTAFVTLLFYYGLYLFKTIAMRMI